MRWWPLLALLGCQDYDGEELADVVVDEAWVEDLDYAGFVMVGGGWSGGGTLVVMDPRGGRHDLPVTLASGGAGLALNMSTSLGGVDVPLKLPRERIRGNQLLGRYKGSAEALAVLFGAQAHHLRNDDDVQMDFVTATFGISVLVAGQWATLLPKEEEPGTGDTGFIGSFHDTDTDGTFWDDTGTEPPTDTGTPVVETGTPETGTPPTDTGDTGP